MDVITLISIIAVAVIIVAIFQIVNSYVVYQEFALQYPSLLNSMGLPEVKYIRYNDYDKSCVLRSYINDIARVTKSIKIHKILIQMENYFDLKDKNVR